MPTNPDHGPGELNHDHVWDNSFSLNNREAAPPRAILDPEEGISGLHDSPDTSDPREKRTSAIGEAIYPDRPGGKTVVYVGEIEAPNEDNLALLRQQMKSYFSNAYSSERLMKIVPHVGFGDDIWAYLARPLSGGLTFGKGVHRSKNHPHTAYARTFQLSVRMSDPRFFLLSGYQEFLDNDAAIYIPVPNYDAPADPIFTINLPVAGETITIRSNTIITPSGPARLRFGPFVGVSGTLVVDFREGGKQATMAGIDVMQYFDSVYSNWWDELIDGLAPGENEITVEGGGQWDVEYYPRCW